MTAENNQKDIGHFDRWSRTYDASWIQRYIVRVHQDMLDIVSGMVSAPQSILDVGCGTGQLLMKARTRWPSARLEGVDPAPGMVEIARRQAGGATFSLGNAESLPMADSSVDVAFSSLSFHHWADQAKGLREMSRVLRPGGCVCIADVTAPDWLASIVRRVRVRGSSGMARLFTEAGLTVTLQRHSATRFVLLTFGVTMAGGA